MHIYDQQVAAQEYLATGATCTAPAECYVSCICGKAGTETFSSGEALGHDWAETIYTWSDDSAACTTSRTCSRDQSHTEIAVAAVGILGISVYGKQKKRKSHAFRLRRGLCKLWKGIVPAILSRGTERLICHLHHLPHSP